MIVQFTINIFKLQILLFHHYIYIFLMDLHSLMQHIFLNQI